MSFWKIDASDVVPGLALLGIVLLLLSGSPAKAQEAIPVLTGEDLPWDGDFVDGPSSTELVAYELVKDMLCNPFLGCDGHGDFTAPRPELYIVCLTEDDICSDPLNWAGAQDFADLYQDAGLVFYEEGSAEYDSELWRQLTRAPGPGEPLTSFPEVRVMIAAR